MKNNFIRIILISLLSVSCGHIIMSCNNQKVNSNAENKSVLSSASKQCEFPSSGVYCDGERAYDFGNIEEEDGIVRVIGIDLHEGGYELVFKISDGENCYSLIEKDGKSFGPSELLLDQENGMIKFSSELSLFSLEDYGDNLLEYITRSKINSDLAGVYLLNGDTVEFTKDLNIVHGFGDNVEYRFETVHDKPIDVISFQKEMYYYVSGENSLQLFNCINEEPEEFLKGGLIFELLRIN